MLYIELFKKGNHTHLRPKGQRRNYYEGHMHTKGKAMYH